jgi:hypothetical protein
MKTLSLYGRMDWFDLGEEPDHFADLPPCFSTAYELWIGDADSNLEKVIALLEPYVVAYFVSENIRGSEGLFGHVSGSGARPVKIKAKYIKLLGVDFAVNPLPLATAEALFDIPVTSAFERIKDLEKWQQKNDMFECGLMFGWDIPLLSQGRQLDLMCGCHEGVQCVLTHDAQKL